MAKPKVLVFLGTSRQGAAVVDALLESGNFEVYATTRSAKSAEALKARGVKCGPFIAGDAASAKAALDAAAPSLVFFTTLMGSREVEGSAELPAAVKQQVAWNLRKMTADASKLRSDALDAPQRDALRRALELRFSVLLSPAFWEQAVDRDLLVS